MDWRFINVITLGFCFMLIFTAFQTSSMIQESVLENVSNETKNNSTNVAFRIPQNAGYISLCIIYVVFAIMNWFAPSVVAICGPKLSMIIGGATYTLFIASFLKPMGWWLFGSSVLLGCGAAIIWTGQGNFLTINSDVNTMGRNSGIFWALLQCSLLFGNLFVYLKFHGEPTISDSSRWLVYLVLAVLCATGTLGLIFLRKNPSAELSDLQSSREHHTGPIQVLKHSFKLLFTYRMILLSVVFAYAGLELTFFSGVYGTCVGHTQHFSDPKAYIGLVGISIGVGEILGGGLFGLLGRKLTSSWGRDSVVLLGFFVHTVCFFLIFINLPHDSPIKETNEPIYPLLTYPRESVALLSAFLLGFGDSCYNTQIYSILGYLYVDDSSSAFALFKFVQSLCAAIGFFYSTALTLTWQLLILQVLNFFAAISYFAVENSSRLLTTEDYSVESVPKKQEEDQEKLLDQNPTEVE